MSAHSKAGDDVWVLGTHMTRFGRYPDKDRVDLASESAMAAMTDGKVTIHDIEILAAGSLFNASAGPGRRIQKQIGPTGIPVYNVANACATAIRTVYMAIKAGEAEIGLVVGVEQMGRWVCLLAVPRR